MSKKSFVEIMSTGFIDKFVENAEVVKKIDNRGIAQNVLTSLKANLDVLENLVPTEELRRTVSSWDVYKLAQEKVVEFPTDASMKYTLKACRQIWEDTHGKTIEVTAYNDISNTCNRTFTSSTYYHNTFFNNDIHKLSVQNSIDTEFLSKVASMIHTAEDFDAILSELNYIDDDFYSVEARNFLYNVVSDNLEDAVEFEAECGEFYNHKDYKDILKKEKAVDKLTVHSDDWKSLRTPEKAYDKYSGAYIEKSDLALRAFNTEDEVRQDSWVQAHKDRGWKCYVVTAEENEQDTTVIVATNMPTQDAADSISDRIGEIITLESYDLKKKSEDEDEPIEYEFKPEIKAPGKTVKPEVIEALTTKAKEAITKLWNRTESLRKLKDIQAEKQADLTAAKNELKSESASIAEELGGYMKMADKAFQKQNLVMQTAYAVKSDEGVILTAIKEAIREVPAAGQEDIMTKDADTIIGLLMEMGKITDDVVKEAEKKIDDFNKGIKMIKSIKRTIHTFPPTEKDIIESSTEKSAVSLEKIVQGITNWFSGFKDTMQSYFSFADEAADEMVEDYKQLQGLIGNTTANKEATEFIEDPYAQEVVYDPSAFDGEWLSFGEFGISLPVDIEEAEETIRHMGATGVDPFMEIVENSSDPEIFDKAIEELESRLPLAKKYLEEHLRAAEYRSGITLASVFYSELLEFLDWLKKPNMVFDADTYEWYRVA